MIETTSDPTLALIKAENKELRNRVNKLTKIIASNKMRPIEELLLEFKTRNDVIVKKIINEISIGVATQEDIAMVQDMINSIEEYACNILAAINMQTLGYIHDLQIDDKYKLLEYERHQLRKIVGDATFIDSIPVNRRAEVLDAITNLRTTIAKCTKLDARNFY